MTAGQHNFIIEKGATFTTQLTWFQSDGVTAVNLTGYTARFQIKESLESSAAVSLTEASGITLGGALGTIVITLSATATSALAIDRGVYALEMDSGGTVTRLLEGQVRFKPEVVT